MFFFRIITKSFKAFNCIQKGTLDSAETRTKNLYATNAKPDNPL